MRETRELYLLDPHKALLFVLETKGVNSISEIKTVIGCDSIDALMFDESHMVYFDDEGVRDGVDHYMMLDGHPDPLIGKVLIAHRDLQESVRFSAPERALARFRCYRPVMDPIIESKRTVEGELTTYLSAVTGFTCRIAQVELAVSNVARAGISPFKWPR